MARPRLAEVLPKFASEFQSLLRSADAVDIASQIEDLEIVERCRCGDDFCATFYTAAKPDGAGGHEHETIALDADEGYLNVDLLDRKVVSIEVLYRNEIRDKLFQIVP